MASTDQQISRRLKQRLGRTGNFIKKQLQIGLGNVNYYNGFEKLGVKAVNV